MDPSQKSFLGARLFVIAALALTAWALVFKTGVANTDEAGIVLQLPAQVGDWDGLDLLFCPDRNCGGQYLAARLETPGVCPRCGAALGNMNWAERAMLPKDTGMVRKYYARAGNRDGIHASIVLSGDDRSSIHRPQVCMTASGHEIVREQVIRIPLEERAAPLEVMVMDMSRSTTNSDGTPAIQTTFYAYWFVGKDRETASHIVRMAWMAYDRVVHGVSHRWAYIALSGARDPASNAHFQTIADFASRLHPALLKPD
ncbi:MAG: exosortase-associated EpsI family protein [Kiritimatiellae bacterium]|jgi:hypothetical protein|nr:exosortase-associated EpsI family protein [Kiritimatiellia bacterium]NLD89967.1 exosortase-associated EpsI family protein [Lentisphaerota bacterium]HPC20029.1 exosortase-associated EpsI family protein [Kiritimatiellia bacterium]